MQLWRKLYTLLFLIWVVLALCEELLLQQGWPECSRLAGLARQALNRNFILFLVGVALGWNLIPMRGD